MAFRVGQKVECIHHQPRRVAGGEYAELGGVYTVRGHVPCTDGIERIYLDEVHNRPMYCTAMGVIEFGFRASGFRPLVERKTDISVFTEMLTDTKITVDA